MKLNFIIDKYYLIANTIRCTGSGRFSSDKNKKDVVEFQNYAWGKSNKLYDLLSNRIYFSPRNLDEKSIRTLEEEMKNLLFFLEDLKESKEFIKIYEQTEKYLKYCEKEWEKNYDFTFKIVSDLTGLDLNKEFIVYITHPNQKNGKYLGDNKIAWGHSNEWENYSTVYLWHEILHSYFGKSKIDHAIIELITDGEIRKCLNGTEYPPFIGHHELRELEKNILSEWNMYLNSKNKDIYKFREKVRTYENN